LFKETMLAALSSADRPGLQALATRDDDDFSIALLDAWATIADVLTFYQERIANESYLRTATERRSVLEMARTIGYELSPGVAASTYLAFTLETADGSPPSVKLDIGTKAQSVPGQDEEAQIYETTEEIEARGEWNELKARRSTPVLPKLNDTIIYLKGISTNLKPGDSLLVIGDEREQDPGNENWDFVRVKSLNEVPPPEPTPNPGAGYTVVELNRGLGSKSPLRQPPEKNPRVYALRQQASLFGHNAPDWRAMSSNVKASYLGLPEDSPIDPPRYQWPDFTIAAISDPPTDIATGTGLYAEYFNSRKLTRESRKLARTDSKVDFNWKSGSPHKSISSDYFSVRWTGWIQPESSGNHKFYTLSDDGVRLWVDGELIIDNWTNHGATEDVGAIRLKADHKYDIKLEYYERTGMARIHLSWEPPGQSKEVIPTDHLYPRDIHTVHLDAIYPKVIAGSWLVLSTPEREEVYSVESVGEDARADFALTAKTTRLVLRGERLRKDFNEKIRQTTVFCQSELLEMAEVPDISDVSGDSVVLDHKVDGLTEGRLMAVSGSDSTDGSAVGEVLTLDSTEDVDNLTQLLFTTDLTNSYKRDTVTINANVAAATHGESKREILGSGDTTTPFQSFTLKQPPLTHVSASTPSGTETTLEVRVNDLLWGEVPTLYGHGPDERIYITRTGDDGKTTVRFGDGHTGERLSTGVENVFAEYRKGIGLDGLVDTGQISQLLSMPLGLKGVTNPIPATGAQDPESLSDARANAPLTVLTLDRVVSLQDYEDFARAFAGIAKALATWTWDGEKRGVFVTVAGPNGAEIRSDSAVYENLLASMRKAGDPHVPIRIKSYRGVTFRIGGRIKARTEYRPEKVLEEVEKVLRTNFSFEARAFGQPVNLSEVVGLIHKVEGVLAVFIDEMYRKDKTGKEASGTAYSMKRYQSGASTAWG
jgi:hypothetical protein